MIKKSTKRLTQLARAACGELHSASSAGPASAHSDIQRVWLEADAVPQIEHAWLFDHLMPIGGDPDGPIYEGWTLLSAMAAQTQRLRLRLLVTSNRFRPPAMLAKNHDHR